MKDFENLTTEEQTNVIMQIGAKLTGQEVWYWEGIIHKLREYEQFVDSDEEIQKGLIDELKDEKEIERLNKRVKECEEAYLRTRHQYSELETKYLTDENIINELEKWLSEKQAIYRDYLIREPKIASDYGERSLTLSNLTKVSDKLQELKGDSSNE